MIVSLNEKIEKLSESDLALEKAHAIMKEAQTKENEANQQVIFKEQKCLEKIKEVEKQYEQKLSKCRSEVEADKRYYWRKRDEVDEMKKALDKRETDILEKEIRVNAKEICVNDVVTSRATKMISEARKNIERNI